MFGLGSSSVFDAVIVGGGPAGLSAALLLGRARRRVLLADAGSPRNAPASAAHSMFTRDGTPPEELLRIGREQLKPYGVTLHQERAVTATATAAGFEVMFESGTKAQARKVLLATGVRDILPEIPGFDAFWGRTVFHCPYCHGWEVAGQPLAVYGNGEVAFEMTKLLLGWSDDLIVFTDGPAEFDAEQRAQLERKHVLIRDEPVVRLLGTDGQLEAVELSTGEQVMRSGLLFRPAQTLRSDLSHQLGCPLTADGHVQADAFGQTDISGVFVAGDTSPAMQQVMTAAASGLQAAGMLNWQLLDEDFARS
ncbi:MAG: NAD(P)/FAD-dependent oxidoreductase [Rhodothermales bacterium]